MFKLIDVELINHPILGSINLKFTGDNELNNGPYTTVIIGPNGSGKSNLLRTITDIFREIENKVDSKSEQKLVQGTYRITYQINDDTYEYTNSKRKSIYKSGNISSQSLKNGSPIEATELKLPASIIASSIMLNDRFFVPHKYYGKIYKYLGVRRINTPSIGGTQNYTRRLVELLLNIANNEEFLSNLKYVLEFIGFKDQLKLDFYPRYRTNIFDGKLNTDYFYNFYVDWQNTLKERNYPPYGYSYFMKNLANDKNQIENLVNTINFMTKEFNLNKKGRHLILSIFDKNFIEKYKNDLLVLGALDLLSNYKLQFIKNISYSGKDTLDSEEISSGEYHLFSSMIGILALISNNCIVFLDEPDISLHPNWQMKYIDFLKKVFQNQKTCQFILATHSHFLVSDLEPTTSHLFGLKREETDSVKVIDLPKSTYGWSAEEILYSVFNVKSTRNSFLEYDLTKLLTLINRGSEDLAEINKILSHLKDLELNEADPLNIIIEKAEKYIGNVDA